MTLAVVCPTRDRPGLFVRMVESLYATTSNASVLAYIDSDQENEYSMAILGAESPLFHREFKPRIGRAAAINYLCDTFREYDAYLLVSDDIVFTRKGWDDEVLMSMASFGDDIGLVHLKDGMQNGNVSWPCVSRKWIDAVGWFNPPRLKHYCQDTAIQALAQGLGRIKAVEENAIRHDCVSSDNGNYQADVEAFLWFMAQDFGPALDRLRAVMK